MWEIRAELAVSGNVKGEQNEQLRYMMLEYFRLCIMRTKRSLGLVHER